MVSNSASLWRFCVGQEVRSRPGCRHRETRAQSDTQHEPEEDRETLKGEAIREDCELQPPHAHQIHGRHRLRPQDRRLR